MHSPPLGSTEVTGYIHRTFTVFKYQPSQVFWTLRLCHSHPLLPTAGGLGGLESRERLLANRRLGAEVIAALIVMLLLFLPLMLQLLHHLY